MRHSFNTTVDVFKGPGTALPGLYVGTFPCRFVIEDAIQPADPGMPQVYAYLTIQAYRPVGCWTTPFFGVDTTIADRVVVASHPLANYWVVLTDRIDWYTQSPYYRAYLSPLPVPVPGPVGGILWNGAALVTFSPLVTGSGGILWNGSATISRSREFVGSGGILWNGAALVTFSPLVTGSGGILWNGAALVTFSPLVTGSGGILWNGAATVSFTPGPTDYWFDTFTRTAGSAVAGSTGEYTPGSYANLVSTAMQVNSNRCTIGTPSGGNCYATFDNGHSTYNLTAKVFIPTTATDNVFRQVVYFFRFVDLSNYHYINFTYASGNDSTIQWFVVATVAGTPTTLNSGSISLASGVERSLALALTSSGISGTLDGNSFSGSSSTANTTSASILGLLSSQTGNAGPYWDTLRLFP